MFARLPACPRPRCRAASNSRLTRIISSTACIANIHPRRQSGQPLKKLKIVDGSVLHRYLRCLTILTDAPGDLSSKELISHLPVLSRIVSRSGTPLAVFLLTPSLTRLLGDDHHFLHNAVSRLFPAAETIRTLAAVVDRLPEKPRSLSQDAGGGGEGLSVLITVSDVERHSHYSIPTAGGSREAGTGHEQGTHISFSIPGSECLPDASFCRFQRVDVPLANTVFQNGRQSTLLSLGWSRGHSRELRCTSSLGTGNSDVFLPRAPKAWRSTRHIPLISITVPRRVVTGVGNIIRHIALDPIQTQEANGSEGEGVDMPATTIPASQELESAVQAYFKRHGLQLRQVGIWALIMPQEHSSGDWAGYHRVSGDSITRKDLRQWFDKAYELGQPIRMKARDRLHRVLSGGGGWGKKQGLLALDPEVTCETREDMLSELGTGERDEEPTTLGEIVKPGDFVQFFIHEPHLQPSPYQEDLKFPDSTIMFGSIPSSIDAVSDELLKPPLERHGRLEVIEDQFGALSEHGIGHKLVDYALSEAGEYEPQSPLSGPVAQTKVDVPFSTFHYYYRKDP
ncbi:hypothetical protein GP486_004822 [Trichoglossum hirsutum]|uniref:Uncharacterized protein n=1 Tax=Trichoglossum hirsutum TaxID=265104 RepID=A0A9P8LAK3_9PEZI|nr:hypothetical protein GP486_004822 [Trichoglossum hirsutum]